MSGQGISKDYWIVVGVTSLVLVYVMLITVTLVFAGDRYYNPTVPSVGTVERSQVPYGWQDSDGGWNYRYGVQYPYYNPYNYEYRQPKSRELERRYFRYQERRR